MNNLLRTVALTAVLASAPATTAAAQEEAPPVRSNTAGFNVGVFLNGSAVQTEGSDVVEAGRGGSLHVGYGFGQDVSIFARANVASIPSADLPGVNYTMAHVDLGARLSLGSQRSALRPFVQGAVNGRAVSFDGGAQGDVQARGLGLSAGVGLEYFVNPTLAVEGGFSWSFGKFSEGRQGAGEWEDFGDDSFSATSGRFDIGLSWHP